jgi:hypothetical protein
VEIFVCAVGFARVVSVGVVFWLAVFILPEMARLESDGIVFVPVVFEEVVVVPDVFAEVVFVSVALPGEVSRDIVVTEATLAGLVFVVAVLVPAEFTEVVSLGVVIEEIGVVFEGFILFGAVSAVRILVLFVLKEVVSRRLVAAEFVLAFAVSLSVSVGRLKPWRVAPVCVVSLWVTRICTDAPSIPLLVLLSITLP